MTQLTWLLPFDIQIGGLMQARAGRPVNITTGSDNNGDSNRNDRPDQVDPNGDPFDPATYDRNFSGRVGNLPRNYASRPGFVQVDFRLSKIASPRGTRLDLCGEAFNLVNHRNDNNPHGKPHLVEFPQADELEQPAGDRVRRAVRLLKKK